MSPLLRHSDFMESLGLRPSRGASGHLQLPGLLPDLRHCSVSYLSWSAMFSDVYYWCFFDIAMYSVVDVLSLCVCVSVYGEQSSLQSVCVFRGLWWVPTDLIFRSCPSIWTSAASCSWQCCVTHCAHWPCSLWSYVLATELIVCVLVVCW